MLARCRNKAGESHPLGLSFGSKISSGDPSFLSLLLFEMLRMRARKAGRFESELFGMRDIGRSSARMSSEISNSIL